MRVSAPRLLRYDAVRGVAMIGDIEADVFDPCPPPWASAEDARAWIANEMEKALMELLMRG